ncbi:MAG: acetolactate decarboxylase [Acidimicrobiia bacterium]
MSHPERRTVFQVSLMAGLLDGVYDGDATVGQLLDRGDFGLGTFNALDGEMIILDSVVHRLRSGGEATSVGPEEPTPFAIVTRFSPSITVDVPGGAGRDEVAGMVDRLVSTNYLYAMRITGRFAAVKTRAVVRQEKPYRPLVEVTRGEPTLGLSDVDGVIAGFRTPLYQQGIGVPGGHVHFIDTDRRRGGHVLDFELAGGTLELCLGTDLHLALPLSDSFADARLTPDDLGTQVEQAERHR